MPGHPLTHAVGNRASAGVGSLGPFFMEVPCRQCVANRRIAGSVRTPQVPPPGAEHIPTATSGGRRNEQHCLEACIFLNGWNNRWAPVVDHATSARRSDSKLLT